MKFMNFEKDQEIGIKKIDIQHKEIINSLNHLYKIKNHKKTEILEYLSRLLGQMKIHFDSEESIMKENKFVNFISHKLEHDRALSKYQNYYNFLKSSKDEFNPDILLSLKHWLESHLEKKDKKLQILGSKN